MSQELNTRSSGLTDSMILAVLVWIPAGGVLVRLFPAGRVTFYLVLLVSGIGLAASALKIVAIKNAPAMHNGVLRIVVLYLLYCIFTTIAYGYGEKIETGVFGGKLDASRIEVVRIWGAAVPLCLLGLFLGRLGARVRDDVSFGPVFAVGIIVGSLVAAGAIMSSTAGGDAARLDSVGRYLRAGEGSFDPNLLAAFLNLVSIFALLKGLLGNNAFYFWFFVLFQAARAFTFSTGSLISLTISIAVAGYYAVKRLSLGRSALYLIIGLGSIVALAIYLWSAGILEVLLYRALLSDAIVYQASVGSRLEQFSNTLRYMDQNESWMIFGVGIQNVPIVTGTGFDLHNSVWRPLIASGIGAFVVYVAMVSTILVRSVGFVLDRANGTGGRHVFAAAYAAAYLGWFVQSLTLPADSSNINILFLSLGLVFVSTLQGERENIA